MQHLAQTASAPALPYGARRAVASCRTGMAARLLPRGPTPLRTTGSASNLVPADPSHTPPAGPIGTLSGNPTLVPAWLVAANPANPPESVLYTPLPPHAPKSSSSVAPPLTGGSKQGTATLASADDKGLFLPSSGRPPIPAHLVNAITTSRYIDLADLLPEALREVQFDRTKYTLKPRDKEGERNKHKFSISTPIDWTVAFSTYVYGHCGPPTAPAAFSLAAYMSIVTGLARRINGQAWCRYYQVFRQAAATNPSLEWHRRDADIWLMALADPPNSSTTVSRALPAASWPTPPGWPDDVYRRWNWGVLLFQVQVSAHLLAVPGQARGPGLPSHYRGQAPLTDPVGITGARGPGGTCTAT